MVLWYHRKKYKRHSEKLLKECKASILAWALLLCKGKMTDKEAKHFYNSGEWKRKRIEILKRDRFECQDCRKRLEDARAAGHILQGEDRKIRRAEEVHHIAELKEHPELGLEDDNLISLCVKCHNLRHGRTPRRFQRKKKLVSKERW